MAVDPRSSSLILFASFWNERQFLDVSLRQLEAIDPAEILLSDGCFDPALPKQSKDGTLETLQEFVAQRSNARLVPAVRATRLTHLAKLMFWLAKTTDVPRAFVFSLLSQFRTTSLYRLNQAETFNSMLEKSEHLKPGSWVSTFDADEFFSRDAIAKLRSLNGSADFDRGLTREVIVKRKGERTLIELTPNIRTWNTPHKVLSDIRFFPTRQIWRPEHGLSKNQPIGSSTDRFLGEFLHYKTRGAERAAATYQVGDRRAPDDLEIPSPPDFEALTREVIENDFGRLASRAHERVGNKNADS